jgi:glutamate dehydrogenase/leucine dehydrogenase
VAVADVDAEKAGAVGVPVLDVAGALTTECDVVAPCALGGVLTRDEAARLRCAVVCGAANNQLADVAAAVALEEHGIVYAPGYVVNAGGIINLAHEWAADGYALEQAEAQTLRIEQTTARVLDLACSEGITAAAAADELARRRIAAEGRSRYRPGEPSVMRDALLGRFARLRS